MECIFCKIVSGEVPSYKVYEDDEFLGFLDIHPLSPGHTLLIPKKHYRWVWDVPNIGNYFEAVKKTAQAIQRGFKTEEVHSRIVGEEVPHAHIWIYPAPGKTSGDPKNFSENAEQIKSAFL